MASKPAPTLDDEETMATTTVNGDGEALVPQLASHHITEKELAICCRVLKAVASLNTKKSKHNPNDRKRPAPANENDETAAKDDDNGDNDDVDGLELYKQKNLRDFRKALASTMELHKRTMFQGKEEEEHFEQRRQERSIKRQKVAESALHQQYLASTQLRKGRVERLKQLQDEAKEEELSKMQNMIPDGHVDAPMLTAAAATTQEEGDDNENEDNKKLPKLRSCYVCKMRYRDLHSFYDQLCPRCAALNWEKRHQTVSLEGRTAVVTGSRVKIGFQICLKLLRAGAHVVATTRFPNSAVAAYRQEPDFDQFKERLDIYGLDFRDVTGLEAFTRYLKQKCAVRGIDILINNACQTVRRPVGYYVPLVEREQQLWESADEAHRSVLGGCAEFERVRRRLMMEEKRSATTRQQLEGGQSASSRPMLPMSVSAPEPPTEVDDSGNPVKSDGAIAAMVSSSNNNDNFQSPFDSTGLSHSAAMSQMIILPEDAGVSDDVLPPGVTDVNGQQLDLRTTNSWLLKMEEVSTPEVMECMFINAIAPFVLNSRLKPLMTTPRDDTRPDRYIINVSAMEGKFYRYKMPNHPHTNMAKAALNMLTRTSAEDLATKHRIFMNSVDTGWINDENPLEKAKKTAERNLFQTPIDEIDAAARVVDPIFVGVREGKASLYGKFLKDYHESEW